MSDQQIDKPRTSAKRGNAETTRTALALVLGGVLAVFAVLNTDEVEVNWILGTAGTPLIIVIVVCLLLGFGAGYGLAHKGARARRRQK